MSKSAMDLPEFGDRDDLREEMIRMFAAKQFARSPVMRKLLSFLVEKTLSGEGERLKAYTIAVDALGKPDEFDAQTDSYPRVQVGRLRNLLDGFYEDSGQPSALRFAIPKGSYSVVFDAAEPAVQLAPSRYVEIANDRQSWLRAGAMRAAAAFFAVGATTVFLTQALATDMDRPVVSELSDMKTTEIALAPK